MNDDPRSHSQGGFHTTRWSLIFAPREAAQGREALEWLCRSYWTPVYGHVRRKGVAHDEALDLTQGFLTSLLETEPFAGLDPARGRFRAWILASLNHFLANERTRVSAAKRGGGRPTLSVEELAAAHVAWEPEDPALPPDRAFDRRWAVTVMEQALAAVEADYAKRGASTQFTALKPHLTGRADPGTYDALAAELNTTNNSVAVAVARLRERFRTAVRAIVRETVGSEEELGDEMAHLFSALRGE